MTRQTGRWCFVWTKRAKSRRSTAADGCCPCARARLRAAPTTKRATAQPACSHPLTSPQIASAANATRDTSGETSVSPEVSEFRRFLDRIDAGMPQDLDIHLVMDNYDTRKTQLIRDWLAKRPRWHVYLTPTSASWLNQVERFFALIIEKQIRRGVHQSVTQLKATSTGFIDQHNVDPRPFRWTKPASDILAGVERFCIPTALTEAAQ